MLKINGIGGNIFPHDITYMTRSKVRYCYWYYRLYIFSKRLKLPSLKYMLPYIYLNFTHIRNCNALYMSPKFFRSMISLYQQKNDRKLQFVEWINLKKMSQHSLKCIKICRFLKFVGIVRIHTPVLLL